MLKYRAATPAAAVLAAWLALMPAGAGAAGAAWEQWRSIEGVFDIDGPRSDGGYVVAGRAALHLLDMAGTDTPFARGPGGYHEDPGAEAYIAVSRGGHVESAGCDFAPDEVFILRAHGPLGVNRVSASGDESGSFTNLVGVTSLGGITFDTTGRFDHRLLVSGAKSGKTSIFAIDCNGKVTAITRSAPVLEGGLAVAPPTFGAFAGQLIAPDELSGKIYAIAPDGRVSLVARPALPTGGDIGVESVGFVPDGFIARGGAVYYADRKTPGNPHPGNDKLLRLSSTDIANNLVEDGDMLVATEGGASMIAIRCAANCVVLPVVPIPTRAHGEGHIAFSVNPGPSPSPAPPPLKANQPLVPQAALDLIGGWGIPAGVFALLVAFLAAVAVQAVGRRGK